MPVPAIRTESLGRTYKPLKSKKPDGLPKKPFEALKDVDLEVRPGELFGLLGPNGAGKTTLIKILTTLLAPTTGRAWINGLDVVADAYQLRPQINMVSGGETSGYGVLTVRENLWLFAQLYGVPSRVAQERIEFMLGVVGLADRARSKVSQLSTGLRQKMNFCRGFITDPTVLFLDEPTLGLDVTSARAIRKFIQQWLKEKEGRTLLLTTHYMAEADELCDRLAIIDRGRVLACDTPQNLKRRVQQHTIFELGLTPGADGYGELGRLPGVRQSTVTPGATEVTVKVALDEEAVVGPVVQRVVQGGSRILTLKKVEPTLEDVFIELVGHSLAEGDQ